MMGMELAPCRILSVTCPLLLLQAAVSDPASLLLFIFRIVAVENNQWTNIYVPNAVALAMAADVRASKRNELSARIRACLRQVCTRMPAAL